MRIRPDLASEVNAPLFLMDIDRGDFICVIDNPFRQRKPDREVGQVGWRRQHDGT